jgi:hypothetical protein
VSPFEARLRGATLIPRVHVAAGFRARLCGLLGRAGLPRGEALLIERCGLVHTLGMRFPLDLVFVDREWCVTRVARGVRPGRVAWGGLRARRVLELESGWLPADAVRPGDRLEPDADVTPAPGATV